MTESPRDRNPQPFLAGGGEMGALMRATDWSKTPLGAAETWSQSLRMMVGFLLANRFPLLLWWGPDYISIYNDPYRPVLGTKHPKSMGQPAHECWAEIWHILQPLIDTPFTGGPATWMEDLPLEINRYGFVEETHFTIAYSPVPDETAPRGIGGVLATVHEITEKVVGERRVVILRDLGARSTEAKSAEEACALAAATLADHPEDVPFALLYLIDPDRKTARLAGSAGVDPGGATSPLAAPLDADAAPGVWPLAEAMRSGKAIVIENLSDRCAEIPPGPWSDPPRCAMVVPLGSNKAHQPAGLLVAGVSPRLRLDDLYRSFLELTATQIATTIANARAYEEEKRRAETLAELDRAKTAFFSNVSHEFRTPLTLMMGPLEEALAAPQDALPQRRGDLALVHRNGLRLLRLVNTLLDFSRIEAGRMQASYEPVDLATFTAELASVFRAATDRAGLTLAVDCPPLPEPVWVDRDMWEKIILNLISNAFKYTLDGGIAVRLRRDGDRAVLAVEDTGTGIPAEELPRLFDRFHRVEGARGRTHEGTGIGLALVQELTRLHGGSVHVDSTPGYGSTFTVAIPLGSAHLPAERLRAERTLASTAVGAQPFVEEALRWLSGAAEEVERDATLPAPPPTPHGGRAAVLLADDNADMRDYLRRLLAARYEVEAVADGEAALDALRRRRFDLVLSDIMMPRLDGFGLVRAIRADPALADLPIVLLSARAGEEAGVEGLEAGADDYLVKPFSARELLARIRANLGTARMRRELLAELQQTLETTDAGITHCGRDLRYISANSAYTRLTGVPVEKIVGRPIVEVIGERAFAIIRPYVERVLRGERISYEAEIPWVNAAPRWTRVAYTPATEADGTVTGWVASVADITEQKRAEQNLLGQRHILERVATGAPVAETLDELMQFIEGQEPGLRAGLLIVAEESRHFRRGSGPHLPEAYHRALDGVPIAPPYLSSCGKAAHQCTAVKVPDIAAETRYAPEWRRLMLQCGLRAVRSTPVRGSDGRVLASLAIYYDHPRDPDPNNPHLIEIATHLAAIALERDEADRALAADLGATKHLQSISTELLRDQPIQALYDRLVEAAAAIMHSDCATMQVLDPDRNGGELLMVRCHGLDSAAAEYWQRVGTHQKSTCGLMLHSRRRVIVPDFLECAAMAGSADLAALSESGIRAAQSTPLVSRSGRLLGAISTHWKKPHNPLESELQHLDLLARQAADLIERVEAERALRDSGAWLAAQKEAFQSAVNGAPLDVSLGILTRAAIERMGGETRCAFYTADASGAALYHVTGMAETYARFIDGFKIGPDSLSCGLAAHTGQPVITPDVIQEPLWRELLWLAEEHGFRGCWSFPIETSAGKIVGTFAMYFKEPREATAQDREFATVLTQAAGIIISRHQEAEERARADAALRQSQENLSAAMAASDSGTFRWDPRTGKFLEFDDNLKRLLGFAPDESVRVIEDFTARVHPDDLPALAAAVGDCRNGADFSMEYRVVLPDGGIRWVYDRARMERDAEGNPVYLVGACTDITKRRQAEEQLRASEEHFRNLADTIPLLAWMAEADGSIGWFNRGWYDYTGTTPEQMVGWGWQAVHDPRVLPEVLARWHASLTSGTPFEMVFPIRGSDGAFRPFLTRVAPMHDGAGTIIRWFGTSTDISGQREIQDTLARLTETLERELASRTRALEAEMAERQKVEAALQQAQRLEAIGQLTGGVAHDFNNLLTVVLGQTEAIALAADGNDRIRSMATAAQRAAERGAQLTNQLLSFSGRQQLRPVTVAIDGLIRGIGDLVRRTIGETITVNLAIPPGLWASRLDPAQFESAILNLAINARDAMPDGGDLRIDARNAVIAGGEARRLDLQPGEYVLVRVIDTGTGMTPEVARRAFEPFYTTKDVGRGTGLGLSQIYGFARQSRGTAVLDSAAGTGTTVSLYLPRAEAADIAADAAADAVPRAAGGTTVLLVEDQVDVREVTEMLLEELGYRVLTAPDGVAARRVLASDERIDLLLTDVVMPNGVSGIDLAKEARRLRQDLRIVIVSGYLRDGNPNAAMSPGMIFLEKPFRQSELADTIALALGRETAARSTA
ncbi:MAG TPA: GAF domain-containing protein [Stellaceae bacterium]|nr:GAF domain-containing protein [Stellaceae bacterium]